jgi:chromosome segregation ATPase
MSQKQDRINEVLAERISQLEDELRAAQSGRERAEKEIRLVKDEAYEVVGQWSAENAELRRKLSALEENYATAQATLKNRDETVACLKEELIVSQQLSTQYSSAIEELHKQNTELVKTNEGLDKSLSAAQCTIATSGQQISDFERLVSKFEAELKDVVAARQSDEEAIKELRKSLAAASSENRTLRQAGEDVSSSTGKLLERVSKLKEENDVLLRARDRLSAEVAFLQVEVDKAREDANQQKELVDSLSADLVSSTSEIQRLNALREDFEKKHSDVSLSLQVSETAAAQQLELIQNLERDIQELRDTGVTAGKVIDDLQAELECSRQRVEELMKEKDDVETEFSTVKECYSNLLIEFDDFKRDSSRVAETKQKDFDAAEKRFADRLSLVEQNYQSAWSSVQDLTDALHAQQNSEFAREEQLARQAIAFEQQVGWGNMLDQRLHVINEQCFKSLTTVDRLEKHLRQVEEEEARKAQQLEAVKNRFRACEQTLSEQRRAFASLEAQLSQTGARLKETVSERDTLAKDNEWLKSQVESMRQELGELDELLNSSLNEMREENERLQLESEELQQKVLTLNTKDASNADRFRKLESDIGDLESELRAQTKTLEITEAELQASKAQVENFSTSLHFVQKRAEELDSLNAELLKTNTSLSWQVSELQERVRSQDEKHSLTLSDKRKESEAVKTKLNTYIEKYEKAEKLLRVEIEAKREAETAALTAKEQNAKLRAAVDELKARCASDAASLKELLDERDDLMRDRDIIVEKYNKLHDAFRNVRKEAHGKIADELRRVMELAVSQEAELQTLRQQNSTLKKSVSMFVQSAQPKAEAIFMERLNLTEGPLRHPKKRSVTKSTE